MQPDIFHTYSHFNQFPGVVATYKQRQICFVLVVIKDYVSAFDAVQTPWFIQIP